MLPIFGQQTCSHFT